ncbi:MAG TPA: PHB depolymerase family esterase [Puia sp.]|nr:PHB depolymerase family esterase [Puia sp.]
MARVVSKRGMQLVLCLLALTFANCQKSGSGKAYRFNGVINVDGRVRTYLLNLPPHYYDTSNLTLVVALHGFGGNAAQAEEDYGITDKANSEGFMVVYPEGTPSDGPFHLRSWNTGACCPVAQDENVDDVHFISVLIDQMIANYKVNPKKVYVAGMSNGAMMAYTLACDLSDKIAAITSVSGTLMVSSPCQPSRAVPILHIHSALDTKVPYDGGIGMAGHYFTPVDSTIGVWTALDSCNTPPQVVQGSGYTFTEWKDYNGKVAIDLYLTQDGGHSWPGGLKPRDKADPPSTAFKATDLLWDFFQHYSLP